MECTTSSRKCMVNGCGTVATLMYDCFQLFTKLLEVGRV